MEITALAGVEHRFVEYVPGRGIEEAAERRGIAIERILKTMVVRVADGRYVLVMVPGDRLIDWKSLRTLLGERRLSLAGEDEAYEATGFRRGTITPFGATGGWPLVIEASVAGAGEVSIGTGAEGIAVHLDADDLIAVTGGQVAAISRPR
jgi:Cys-tRNA(Pro)/Cys-tRNA(Cys) deacylase